MGGFFVFEESEGFIYIYVSNESASTKKVYFDDLKVTINESNIVQKNSYYPFGLQHSNSWSRVGRENKYQFNAASELNEETQNYEMYFRSYDPVIGRMSGVDPYAHLYTSHTPYHYGLNDPIAYNDPSGGLTSTLQQIIDQLWAVVSGGSGGGGATWTNGGGVQTFGYGGAVRKGQAYNDFHGTGFGATEVREQINGHGHASHGGAYWKTYSPKNINNETGWQEGSDPSSFQGATQLGDTQLADGDWLQFVNNYDDWLPFPDAYDPDYERPCPCITDLRPGNRGLKNVIRNMKHVVGDNGQIDVADFIYPLEKKITGGNWLERNIGNPILNYWNEAFGSIYNERSTGFLEDDFGNTVQWIFWPEIAGGNNNIGINVDDQKNPHALSGFIYQIRFKSARDAGIFSIGFRDFETYKFYATKIGLK